MKFVPNFVRQIVWKFKCFALTKHACLKNWFNSKYFFLFELLTLKAVLLSNKLVRQYIILKGKNPDYVSPPLPPPPPLPVQEPLRDAYGKEVFYTTRGKSTNINCGFRNEWVSKPSTHPVLKLRSPSPASEPLQRTSVVADPAPEILLQELQKVVEEIKSDITNIEVSGDKVSVTVKNEE